MKAGERIRIIKECADSLLTRPFADAQLTLDQFGFRTWDASDADLRMYFIDQVKDAGDPEIVDLHTYLSGEDAAPAVRVTDRPWGLQPVSLFLSHHHEQRHIAGKVKWILAERYGIDAFVAHDDIRPSKQWREVIKAGLVSR